MSLLTIDIDERIAVVTLTDAGRRNAVSAAMADALVDTFHDLGERNDVHLVIVTGHPPAFSAGADLDDLDGADADRLRRIYDGFLAVAACPWPTIAAVNGPAVGAGFNLALSCDVRIASRSARFESRFLDLAIHPGGGHTWMLQRLVGPQTAMELTVLGRALTGEDAARLGLACDCVHDDDLLPATRALAATAAAAPRELVRRTKRTLRETEHLRDHREAVELELEPQAASIAAAPFRERLRDLRARIARSGRSHRSRDE